VSLFAFADDELLRLARAHGTPSFLYSGATARECYRRLRAVLPARARLAFAVKANPHPDLLALFASLGASFDCASEGELRRVAALKLPPGRTFFAGPGKRTAELELALEQGVRVQAEGWEDLERLDALARARGLPPLAVNLRVHPASGVAESNRIIGGVGPSAFGIDEEALPEVLPRAARLTHVRIEGLHVFAASNERDASKLLATHRMVLELANRVSSAHGLTLRQLDLGGGLGVPYSSSETPLDLDALGRGLADLLREHAWFTGELILEPGRFLAAPCGVYLARVVRVKESRGARFAILEGGVNHLLRPLLTQQAFPVRAVGRSGATTSTTLAGPLCTSLDRLGVVDLPDLAPDDVLAFGTCGAYGFTEGMTHFLSHPVPPEVFVPPLES
jgi:diaminopimelate decarboxylase